MHRLVRNILVIAVVTTLFGSLSVAPARASDGELVIEGGGFGHGIGLSQYGSQALAENGRTYPEILSFYYTGSYVSSISDVLGAASFHVTDPDSLWINVLKTSKGSAAATKATVTALEAPGTLCLNEPASLGDLSTSTPAPDVHVEVLQQRLLDLGFDPNGVDGWFGTGTEAAVMAFQSSVALTPSGIVDDATRAALWPRGVDGESCYINVALPVGSAAVVTSDANGQCLVTGAIAPGSCFGSTFSPGGRIQVEERVDGSTGESVSYDLGTLRFRPASISQFHLVLQIGIDDYLIGLDEVPSWWNAEALKAQVVAGRTYALFKAKTPESSFSSNTKATCWCQLYSTISDQNHTGYNRTEKDPNGLWAAAVSATSGAISTHPSSPNLPIEAYYSSSTGGATETVQEIWSATLPYLVTVQDPWSSDPSAGNPLASWTKTSPLETVASKLGMSSVTTVEVIERNTSNSARTIRFTGTSGSGSEVIEDRTSSWMMSNFGLYSRYFDVRIESAPPDGSGPWGPFSSADEFVLQQYRDFLGREGEAAGVAVWTDALVTEALTPEEVIDQFMGSAEFELKVAPIVRLYSATFLRLPDYDGLVNWVNASNAGMPLTVIANEFTTSEEFQIRYGSLSDTDFVELLYQNVLGRGSDPVGLANWVGRLESGQSRGSILVGFSESPEYRANMEHDVVVTMAYVGMLRRAPEPGGFDDWVGQMDAGLSRTDLLTGFFRSIEYASRFQ